MGDLGINLHISWDYYGQKWEGLCSCSYAGLMYPEIKTDLGYGISVNMVSAEKEQDLSLDPQHLH